MLTSTFLHENQKKSSKVFEKLGQKISHIKEDLAENFERRRHLTNVHRGQINGDATRPNESSAVERVYSINQLALSFARKTNDETTTNSVGTDSFRSFDDIFSSENRQDVKKMIISGVRQQIHRTGTNDGLENKATVKSQRKPTLLLAGPKFRSHTVPAENDFRREVLFPLSAAVSLFVIFVSVTRPICSFFSGFCVGFSLIVSLFYLIYRFYLHVKNGENVIHEWINFPELENEPVKNDKRTSSPTCVEMCFGQYDVNRDREFQRFPAVIQLNDYRLTVKLPKKLEPVINEEKNIRFAATREYFLREAKMILVPEVTLNRMKYWLPDYPIVLDGLKSVSNEKSELDNDSNSLSLFFETGPNKEEWFHKLSLVLRQGKEEIEREKRLAVGAPSAPIRNQFQVKTASSTGRTSEFHANSINFDERLQMKTTENVGPPYADTLATEKFETDALRSQINENDILNDMAEARIFAEKLRNESNDKEKEKKDQSSSQRTTSIKKKHRKHDEHLDKILDAPDCLDEAAITMNFLIRRILCDAFEETIFKDLMKEKIESKLKEIAVSVLEDLHVETIDLGKTFPVVLKVEPMEFNSKGLWFNLFFFYRGNFEVTIKTRLLLTRLIKYDPDSDQPMYAQHHSAQLVHKQEEQIDDDDLLQRQKLLAKEPEIPENAASRKLGTLLTKVALNKHFQRIAGLKPVAGVIEKLSNAEVGAKLELTSFSGSMTINIPPPPSDRLWIGFPEMPDLNLKVTPVVGESKYSYALIHDFLEARIRDELKRMLVLPAMDDQLLSFFRDWVIDVIGQIASKPSTGSMETINKSTEELDKSTL